MKPNGDVSAQRDRDVEDDDPLVLNSYKWSFISRFSYDGVVSIVYEQISQTIYYLAKSSRFFVASSHRYMNDLCFFVRGILCFVSNLTERYCFTTCRRCSER